MYYLKTKTFKLKGKKKYDLLKVKLIFYFHFCLTSVSAFTVHEKISILHQR